MTYGIEDLIFDRTLEDVTNRTAKGYFNVSDWQRIRDALDLVAWMIFSYFIPVYEPNLGSTPSTSTIPSVADINKIPAAINILVEASQLPLSEDGLVHLKDDYTGGANGEAPDYLTINDWERCLSLLWYGVEAAGEYRAHCGVASCGQPRWWQNRARVAARINPPW